MADESEKSTEINTDEALDGSGSDDDSSDVIVAETVETVKTFKDLVSCQTESESTTNV